MSRRRKIMMIFIGGFSEQVKSFIDRVKEDNGVIENAKCIDDKLKI
tara:strand:- start:88 stop:225 length:138 start_codon:yes stop_codon:yes gene_type:complete